MPGSLEKSASQGVGARVPGGLMGPQREGKGALEGGGRGKGSCVRSMAWLTPLLPNF